MDIKIVCPQAEKKEEQKEVSGNAHVIGPSHAITKPPNPHPRHGKLLELDPIRRRTADSFLVGTWLSLVEHSLGVRGVGSSNLPVPTNTLDSRKI